MTMRRWGTRYVGCIHSVAGLFCALLAAGICAAPALAGQSLERLREEFRQETDPVQRARLFPKLGVALLAEMKKKEGAREYDGVPALFLEYRDGATAAYSGLEATGRDAEKQSAGFRELEMHLRKSLHPLNDIVFGMPFDEREPLRKPQKDIEELDNRLVKGLFPRRPETHKTPPSEDKPHPEH
jgi:hypothetical protein